MADKRAEPPALLLGFDYGVKRIGVAVGQRVTGTARALTTLRNPNYNQPDWAALSTLLEQWQPDALVVGLPRHMDGTEHELTRAARRFGNRLGGRYNLPVYMVDERLTSVAAEAQLEHAPRREPGDVDSVAAQIILQSWLDRDGEP